MSSTKASNYIEGRISIREFLVDFFGSLMPGVFFLILILFVFISPLLILVQVIFANLIELEQPYTLLLSRDDIILISKIPVVFDIAIFLLFLAFPM